MDFPNGVSFHTGRMAAARRSLEGQLVGLLTAQGFEEVIPPVFEYYRPEPGSADEGLIYTFPDQLSGRMLALRWDFTLQMARLAASRFERRPGELRWCYRGNVFRTVREHAGEKRQLYQIGAELIGDSSRQGTARMVELAVSLLRAAGLEEFALVVGHVGFVERLVGQCGLAPRQEQRVRDVLRRKDLSALGELAASLGLPTASVERFERGMYLMGGEEVLGEAEKLLEGAGADVIEELEFILGASGQAREHVLLDLTEPRGFDYYTGLMFQVMAPKVGQEVCKGGRYDNLLGTFGCPAPSVGFALDLDLLLQSVDHPGREI